MTLERLIDIASEAYDVCSIDQCLVKKYHENPNGDFGDTLAQFVALELKDTFDPNLADREQLECAADAIQTAISQLTGIACEFENLID